MTQRLRYLSNPFSIIPWVPCIDLRGNQSGTFATFMFASHVITTVKSPMDILIVAKTGIYTNEHTTALVTILKLSPRFKLLTRLQ